MQGGLTLTLTVLLENTKCLNLRPVIADLSCKCLNFHYNLTNMGLWFSLLIGKKAAVDSSKCNPIATS